MASAAIATSSSSSTLWATASRNWEIPPKPKPGRKPKKDAAVVAPEEKDIESTEVDSKGRRVQNRAAQRAFRERKQNQLAELQARVHAYELGEGERNVALQQAAKRLKAENDELKTENNKLREENERLRFQLQSSAESLNVNGKRRNSLVFPADAWTVATKRSRTVPESPMQTPSLHSLSSPSSLASSMVSSPEMNLISLPNYSPHMSSATFAQQHHQQSYFPTSRPEIFQPSIPISSSGSLEVQDCGFCPSSGPCVCHELVIDTNSMDNMNTIDGDFSILDNLPAYMPAVPLRRRHNPMAVNSIFPVHPAPNFAPEPAVCSGDPNNCGACQDDPFGKAFCSALGDSVAQLPSNSHPLNSQPTSSSQETMPCDEAWRQLKQHPAIGFADLKLLADVVARRSKCTGPQVIISPALGTLTPERLSPPPTSSDTGNADESLMLSDPNTYRELIPHNILMQCGRSRIMEVQTDAVRDALRLLDARFAASL